MATDLEHQKIRVLEAERDRLRAALEALIDVAVGMDLQIDGEWGVGAYVEDSDITAARTALTSEPTP